jgi:hypothetical protein
MEGMEPWNLRRIYTNTINYNQIIQSLWKFLRHSRHSRIKQFRFAWFLFSRADGDPNQDGEAWRQGIMTGEHLGSQGLFLDKYIRV